MGLAMPLPRSEHAVAEMGGRVWVLGGYPPGRLPSNLVQVYDPAMGRWSLGPRLPQPVHHTHAAAVSGKRYVIGGEVDGAGTGRPEVFVANTWVHDPAVGGWVARAPMPTARSGGGKAVLDGRIYVAGGRPPRGHDFAVYDPTTDRGQALPDLPTQRNHITGAAINGRIHVVGGRLGPGLSPLKTTAHEVFDPQTRTWTTAAPMLRGRSGINGVMARGCFHAWGGEDVTGMIADHDYYDPRTDKWTRLRNMPIPVHGINGSAYVDGLIWVAGGGTNRGGAHASHHNQVFRPTVSCE